MDRRLTLSYTLRGSRVSLNWGQTDVVVQAQNDSQTKNEAGSDVGNTNVVGEQKKAVSWGTVKTHKVYAVEDPDRSNGEKEVCTLRRERTTAFVVSRNNDV